jgi:hypothetical protein
MPESVKDRCTKAHEYLFLLSKNGNPIYWTHRDIAYQNGVYKKPSPDYRWINKNTGEESIEQKSGKEWKRINLWSGHDYYYDQDAIKEPCSESFINDPRHITGSNKNHVKDSYSEAGAQDPKGPHRLFKPVSGWDTGPGSHDKGIGRYTQPNSPQSIKSPHGQGFTRRAQGKGNAKTFRGGGKYTKNQSFDNNSIVERDSHGNEPNLTLVRNKHSVWTISTQPFPDAHFATFPVGLVEPCILAGSKVDDIVLDPFMGSGTVAAVCEKLHRRWIGIELSEQYCEIAAKRIEQARKQTTIPQFLTGG